VYPGSQAKGVDLAMGTQAAGWAKATKHMNCTLREEPGPRATLANMPSRWRGWPDAARQDGVSA
jgi:hypothetical protein